MYVLTEQNLLVVSYILTGAGKCVNVYTCNSFSICYDNVIVLLFTATTVPCEQFLKSNTFRGIYYAAQSYKRTDYVLDSTLCFPHDPGQSSAAVLQHR